MTKSKQRDLDRERAKAAWQAIESIKGNKDLLKEYTSLARSAPADIMSNGLGQTVAFWRAKKKDKKDSGHARLLVHLTEWLSGKDRHFNIETNNVIEWIIELDDMRKHRRAVTEAIAFLVWVKRFAEAEAE